MLNTLRALFDISRKKFGVKDMEALAKAQEKRDRRAEKRKQALKSATKEKR